MKFLFVLLVIAAIVAVVLVIRKRKARKPVQVQSSLRQERSSYNLPASTSYTGAVYETRTKAAPYSANRPAASKPAPAKPRKKYDSDDSVVGSDYDAGWATEPTTYNEPVQLNYGYTSGGSSDSGYSSGGSSYSSGSSDSGYSSGGSSSSSSDSGSSGGGYSSSD